MANTCISKIAVKGSKDELQAFVSLLNEMENHSKSFGKRWIGNVLIASGLSMEEIQTESIYCRGTIHPKDFSNLDDEYRQFQIDDDGVFRFDMMTKNIMSYSFLQFIKTKFPSFIFAWHTIDEFLNFSLFHDPEHLLDVPYYCVNGFIFGKDEYPAFLEHLRGVCDGLTVPVDKNYLKSSKFRQTFEQWIEMNEYDESVCFFFISEEDPMAANF